MTDQTVQQARERLKSQFGDVDPAEHGAKWDELWNENFVPWDRGVPNPALIDFLDERQDLLGSLASNSRKKVLVPGCGKGYDVLLLASRGYDAYGLDYSEKALEEARKVEKEFAGKGIYEAKSGVQPGKITWLVGDFFKDDFLRPVTGEHKFDLIYDYTFLSALPPSLRPAWSKRFVELLAPQGRVVCIEFPTYKAPSTGGPPWGLPPKVYTGHLERPGEELPYDDEKGLLEDQLGPPTPSGLKRIAHFQPKRTHQIGYDEEGKVTDWLSVWAHPTASA
ncbi:thiol methyltransferase-like protein [Xylogone sp. PMI_703]|nr:thiol methyltransferase-like protein [Xylogone sp. PMI_703]